jgi:metal-responsive CopG/Arc/MetJ family transcriptional regulator
MSVTTQIAIACNESVIEDLDALCERQGRTREEVAEAALIKYLEDSYQPMAVKVKET